MKKHRLLFLWLSLLLCAVGARAEEVTIGDGGEANNSYLPGYNYFNYSYTQQIYTADEIGVAGTINSIAFKNTGAEKTRTYSIYMALTDKTAFTDGNDWVPMSADDLVFEGEVTFAVGKWTTIDLNAPFAYDGSSNLIVAVADNTGSYSSSPHMACLVFSASNQAIRAYRDASAYDIANPGANGATMNIKNQIVLDITAGGGPTCPKPKGVKITSTTTTTATVEWNAEEGTQYNIHVLSESSEDFYTGVTSPYTITGLEASTTYTVQVQTACSETDQSDWTSQTPFSTAICEEEDQCLVSYTLTDSYGDGWNGNAIKVVDIEKGKVLGTLTIGSGYTVEGALPVCPGREIQFEWVLGSYPGEASWVIYDVNGDVICEGQGASTMKTGDVLATYLVDCSMATCAKPKDLKLDEVSAYSATLSWTPGAEDQSAWEIVYSTEADFDPDTATPVAVNSNPFDLTGLEAETTYYAYVRAACSDTDHSKWSNVLSFTTLEACPTPTYLTVPSITATSATINWEGNADNYEVRYAEATGFWLQYDDESYVGGIGNTTSATWTWGVMYPGSMVTIDKLTKIAIYETSTYNTQPITVNIYSGGDDAPGTLLYTEEVTPEANDAMHIVTLSSPVAITPGENVWITLTETGTYCLSYCLSTEPNNNWVLNGGQWAHVSDLSSSLAGDGWMIRGFIGEPIDPETTPWTTGSCTDNTIEIDGLNPQTSYVFQVRAKCDEESYSKWAETNFTTEEADASPEIEVTDVTATTATVDWTDKGADPSSWDLWYRLIGNMESFENGLPQGWTTIDNDNDGKNWTVVSGGIKSHSGDAVIASYSYDNGTNSALSPDNWLISPEVTLGGSMSFWAIGQDAGWAGEHFAVYLSQDGNTDVSKFTQIYPATGEIIATSEYVQHTIDLSAYKGKGYLAIRHFNITNMFCLNIDDIAFTEPGQNTDWVEMNGLTNHPATIEGLDPEMTYEVQVRTHFGNGDVSEWVSDNFTTLSAITLFDKDMDEDPNNVTMLNLKNGFTLDVTISGRTLYKSGNWNSLCLPFDIENIEASPLAGATVKELTAARIEGTMLYLTYVDALSIEAGKSYIIKWDSGDDIVNPTFGGVTLNATADGLHYGYEVIDLNTTEEIYSIGLYKETILDQSESVLYLGNDNKMYYPATSGFHVGAFRTLVTIPDESTVNGTVFEIDGTATGITEVNGLEIIGGKWYSVDGRKLPNQPKQKGVYINNGRKVVVK